jgi:L-aminopeptidase/D-esterase-like protein
MTERHDDLCDVAGLLVGHDTQAAAGTGCTVVLCEWPARGAVDVLGGAPATRETDLLDPGCFMQEVHAILLTGGSAFGLDAAAGVMRTLEARGSGFDAGVARVPIVPGAALFDLGVGRSDVRPDGEAGARAAAAAHGGPLAQGSVGAGTGATVGKSAGPQWCLKGGIGSASAALPDGHVLGALAAVNALGDVFDPATGAIVAGARRPEGTGWLAEMGRPPAAEAPFAGSPSPLGANTTLAVIATDAPWSKADLGRMARMAHDGLARTIRPSHTPFDGDVVFALSTARDTVVPAPDPAALALAGHMAAETLARAVLNGVRNATGLHGVPALRELPWATA